VVGNGIIGSVDCVALHRASEGHGALVPLEYWTLRYSGDGLPQDKYQRDIAEVGHLGVRRFVGALGKAVRRRHSRAPCNRTKLLPIL
jgi:hypothetical protein